MNSEDSDTSAPWPIGLCLYAAAIALFHLWANTIGTLPSLWMNSLHLGLLASLLCWTSAWQASTQWLRGLHAVTGVLALAGGIYLIFAEEALRARGEIMIGTDIFFAAVTVIITLILCRRNSGWTIPVMVIIATCYILFLGRFMDGVFHFRGLGWERVVYRFYFTGEGLFGMVGSISATFVFMFILFSAFLLKSGGGECIIRIARILTYRLPGGAAYVAILSSGMLGSVTGSAVANTVSTGSISIPMMKQAGFRREFAAGIEAAASTGGQLMPPVMGAGAFLMAQFTGLPYATIVAVSVLPAVMYFLSLAFFIFLEVNKQGIGTAATEPPEKLATVLREGIHFPIPIIVLIALLIAGFSPTYAAGAGIVSVVLSSWITRRYRMGVRVIFESLVLGTRNAAPIALLLLCTGLIIGALNMTGTGVAISQLIISGSGGYLLVAMILIALASLLLGMGLPVTAAYVMLATVAVPVLQDLGVSLLTAHLIIFWLSQDSNVTPPVSLAAFAAAGIAGASPMHSGFQAWRLAKALYLIPLLFAYTPLIDGSWPMRLLIALVATLALPVIFYSIRFMLKRRKN